MQSELKQNVELLAIHRDALKILGRQLARFGDNAPTHKELEYTQRLTLCTNHIYDSIELMKQDFLAETEALSVLSIDLSERGLFTAIGIIQDVANFSMQFNSLPAINSIPPSSEAPVALTSIIVEKLRKLIGNDETGQAIVLLLIQTRNSKLYDTALVMSAQYKRLKEEQIQGTTAREELETNLSNLNSRLLKMINEGRA